MFIRHFCMKILQLMHNLERQKRFHTRLSIKAQVHQCIKLLLMKMEARIKIHMNLIWRLLKMEVNGDTWSKESNLFYNLVATWNPNITKS